MKKPTCPQPSTDYKKPSFNEIDKLARLLLPVGYAWPASGLNGYDMAKLQALKQNSGKPVTELLRDAVQLLFDTMTADAAQSNAHAKVPEKRAKVIQSVQPSMEAHVSSARRHVQRTLFSDPTADTATCAETDAAAEQ